MAPLTACNNIFIIFLFGDPYLFIYSSPIYIVCMYVAWYVAGVASASHARSFFSPLSLGTTVHSILSQRATERSVLPSRVASTTIRGW